MMKLRLSLLIPFILLSYEFAYAQTIGNDWPRKVLITNDDGIDDPKMIELARAFAKIAETYVVAPIDDRSGSAHYASVFSKHILNVEQRQIGDNITAYAVDGYPADCVFLALNGLLKENPPDLVISGINDGPNLGFDWLASGTIGAARIATYWGVPSIAVSGLKTEIPGSLDAAIEWIVRLAQSKLVRELKPKQYLTVSIPRVPPSEIKGVKVAKRAGILLEITMVRSIQEKEPGNSGIWHLTQPKPIDTVDQNSDAALYRASYIVIVPMIAEEDDNNLINFMNENLTHIPEWNGKN